MPKPFATIILAGGRGTRMGSSDKHKVCFEVLGVPVIIRALETYNLCGAAQNVVVVGMMAESVMTVVNRRFSSTAYAFQDRPLGTGDAARRGAEILERLGFQGNILVVAGDKVIDPRVVRQLLTTHERSGAGVTLATAKRPPRSSSGILLSSTRGNIVGILEEGERQRLVCIAALESAFNGKSELSRETAYGIIGKTCSERSARTVSAELWRDNDNASLSRSVFEHTFTPEERSGKLVVGNHRVPVGSILERFDQMNLSTYLFRAPVLFDALGRLRSNRASQEEYLTDVFALLAKGKHPVKIIGYEIEDARDLMAFNNPQELLAIEEVYRQQEGQAREMAQVEQGPPMAGISQWDNLFNTPSPAARSHYQSWYGEDVPWSRFSDAIGAFQKRFGSERAVSIFRSPGRINLMGRHIDHQGGTVNVMAVNREIMVVAAPRNDDTVNLANSDGGHFTEETFRISDMVASLNWDDWQRVVDGPRLQRLLDSARGSWANYVKAAILRLQEQFRDRRLRGLDLMVTGDIPMGAGLSSSSALVVAAADVVRSFNHLPVSARRLVSLCGEGEWFVGTRGGAADHAAIKLSRRGCVTRVGFFPFHLEDSAKFFPDYVLIACNSGVYAGKSNKARNTFNAKVTAYHIGRVWFKMLRPDLAARIEHLRDINIKNLGLSASALAKLLGQLPARLTRAKVQAALAQVAEAERDRLEKLFLTHDAPAEGYAVRDVVLFGLSEMARARQCLDLLKAGDAAALGGLMAVSHDGDRVSRRNKAGAWKPAPMTISEADLVAWSKTEKRAADLAGLSGSYACSLPELDRIADLASEMPGVAGSQLAGAGLGGCIMVLAKKDLSQDILAALANQGINGEVFRPIAGACNLVIE